MTWRCSAARISTTRYQYQAMPPAPGTKTKGVRVECTVVPV